MEQIGLDRLTGLVAFARAASLGSYTAAARSLGISPSAVSKSVQRLEQHLGLRLFSRTTRSLSLTAEGRDLLDRALKLLRQAEEIEQAVFAAKSEPTGTLKISAPLPIGINIIAPALPRFRALYPKVVIDMRLADRYVDLIEEGYDISIRVGDPGDSRLISKHLAPHRVCVFASPSYLAERGTPARPEDIADHECVNFRYQSSGQEANWPFQSGDRVSEIRPRAGLIIDVSDAVAATMAAGGGLGLSATYVAAPYVRRGELVPVLYPMLHERFPITAVWPESRRANPAVKAFVAFLGKVFPKQTPWDLAVDESARIHRPDKRG